jgi:F0F1-type ATP synthase membrane subunit a
MFAGHCVIKILSFFILILVPFWIPVITIYYYMAFFAIFCLEVFVSFLQAYIFVMLVIIYNNLVFDTH